MGVLVEGYDLARKRHDDEVAEIHRKDDLVDRELHDLAAMLERDRQFMKDNGIGCDIGRRVLHVSHLRSPALTVHFNAEAQEFTMTVMHDGTMLTTKTVEECARGIGEALFKIVAPRGELEAR